MTDSISQAGVNSILSEAFTTFEANNRLLLNAPGKSLITHVTREVQIGEEGEEKAVTFVISDSRIKTGGADDKIYAYHKDVWENNPRGCAFVYVKLSNGDLKLIHILTGLRKFGNAEDNYTSELKVKENEIPVREYYTRKENGECFHVAAFVYNDTCYWVFGSKNVHGVVRDEKFLNDLNSDNYTEERYGFFKEMGTTFHDTLLKIGREKRDLLLGSLTMTNHTFSAESCSSKHQHLVDYFQDEEEGEGGEGNQQDQLRFFAMSSPAHSSEGLASVTPTEFADCIKQFGLTGVEEIHVVNLATDEISKTYREAIRQKMREDSNSEGAVVYVEAYNPTIKSSRIYHMYKYKNNTYVLERAVRERMRAMASSESIKTRIAQLHIKHPREAELLLYFLQFNAWCRNENFAGRLDWKKLFDSWVTTRKQFDKLTPKERQEALDQFNAHQMKYQQKQLMFVGPPGSGKSTVGKTVEKVLKILFPQLATTYLNQDTLGGRAKNYHKAVTAASKEQSGVLILDKCNHTSQVREGTYNALNMQNLIYIRFVHPDGPEALLAEVTKRIDSRSWGHLNLHPGPQLNGILNRFVDQMQELSEEELSQSSSAVVEVDITKSTSEQVQTILEALQISSDKMPSESQINEVIAKVKKEELELLKKNSKKLKTSYWSLELDETNKDLIFQYPTVQQFLKENPNLVPQETLHMTILYCLDKKVLTEDQKNLDAACFVQLGKEIEIQIKGLHYNNKAMALLVEPKDLGSDNDFPHITLATASGTNPKYSNKLLAKQITAEAGEVEKGGESGIAMNWSVSGTVTRNVTI